MEFPRRLLASDNSSDHNEKAELALQSMAQKPNESVAIFVEDMSRLFRRADPGMSEEQKVRHLMLGVKQQLFAGLVRNPPATVGDLVREATTMERSLQQRTMIYGHQSNLAACASSFDEKALRELVRSVVRKEIQALQQGDCRPTFAAGADVIRDEIRRSMAPVAPPEVQRPVTTYTDGLGPQASAVGHPVPTSRDILRMPASATHQITTAVTQPFRHVLNPATRYDVR